MFDRFEKKLKRILMGISLGIASAIIYIIFFIAHHAPNSQQMSLTPISNPDSAVTKPKFIHF